MSIVKACISCKNKKSKCRTCVMGIKMNDIVVPKDPQVEWKIGRVTGMSRFDLIIGPLLDIKDIISGKNVTQFPMHVDKMVRVVLSMRSRKAGESDG